MTAREADNMEQFIKLTASLTKQGFNFVKTKGVKNALTFTKAEGHKIWSPWTKLPYTDGFVVYASDNKKVCYGFKLWANREIK